MKPNDKPTEGWACPKCFGRVRVETAPGHALVYPDGHMEQEDSDVTFDEDAEAECPNCNWYGVASETCIETWPEETLRTYQESA
jgi:hypothetical protein